MNTKEKKEKKLKKVSVKVVEDMLTTANPPISLARWNSNRVKVEREKPYFNAPNGGKRGDSYVTIEVDEFKTPDTALEVWIRIHDIVCESGYTIYQKYFGTSAALPTLYVVNPGQSKPMSMVEEVKLKTEIMKRAMPILAKRTEAEEEKATLKKIERLEREKLLEIRQKRAMEYNHQKIEWERLEGDDKIGVGFAKLNSQDGMQYLIFDYTNEWTWGLNEQEIIYRIHIGYRGRENRYGNDDGKISYGGGSTSAEGKTVIAALIDFLTTWHIFTTKEEREKAHIDAVKEIRGS